MDAGLRNKMRTHSFRHDLPELDLTHTMNAAVTLQEIFRAKRARREARAGEAALADALGGARDDAPPPSPPGTPEASPSGTPPRTPREEDHAWMQMDARTPATP